MRVIVGSRDLWPTPTLASSVLTIMVSTPDRFSVRASSQGRLASPTEELTWRIAERLGLKVEIWTPTGAGRGATFIRDIRMLDLSSGVHAFFAPGRFMEGGTGHVVYCALRRGVTVHAYELDAEGQVVETASDEGELNQAYSRGWEPDYAY